MASLRDELRLRLGVPLIRATTLPRRWYGDPEHHHEEVDAVFKHGWSCVGTTDALATNGSFTTALVGGDLPVVITRDTKGALHGFLNVCRIVPHPSPRAAARCECCSARTTGGSISSTDGSRRPAA